MKEETPTSKFKWCNLILIITMTVLLIRLWDLQIMRGSEMRRLSEQKQDTDQKGRCAPRDHV